MFSTLLAFLVKSTLIFAAAWLLSALLRRHSAAARHLVWTGASAAILALPLLSISLPAWHVDVTPPALVFQTATTSTNDTAPASPAPASLPAPRRALDWQTPLLIVWAAGCLALLASMARAYLIVAGLRRTSPRIGSEQSITILQGPPQSMPMAFGVAHPVIFLPSDATSWSVARRSLVLAHEIAHVRRADVAAQILARVALALNWCNPLAWKAWREFVTEREHAADDIVLNTGAAPSTYAEHLLELARTLHAPAAMSSAAVAIARRPQLEQRIRAILAPGIQRTSPARAWAIAAIAIAAPLAAFQASQANIETLIRAATSQGNFAILDDAAKSAAVARDYATAQKLLEASLELRKSSGDRASGLLGLGEIALRQGKRDQAEAYYRQAIETLGDSPAAAKPLIKLGVIALAKKEPAKAAESFDRARSLNSSQAAAAYFWLAVARRAENRKEEAEQNFRSALAVQDPKSPDSAALGTLFAAFLRENGREAEAAEADARTTELRKAMMPAAPPKSADVHKIGGNVKPPKLLQKSEPEYSEEARAAKLTGTSVLYVEIQPDGRTHNLRTLRPLGLGLDERAIEAVGKWQFEPGKRDGQPVSVAATIEVNWRLL